jgi:hypothetical protein
VTAYQTEASHSEVRVLTDVVRELAVKAGVEFDGHADPKVLTQRLSEAQTVARQRTVELAVYLSAAKAGADPVTLLDSLEGLGLAEQLDPEAPDFDLLVGDLVREAAKQPKFQAQPGRTLTPQQNRPPAQLQPAAQFQQPPAQPTAASSDAPGGNRLWTEADYRYWTAPGRDRDGTIVSKAIADGLLVDLGIGRSSRRSWR